MEIFRTKVRHIVQAIKSIEERQKRCKENLVNELKAIQNNSISTLKKIALHTKQILCEIRTIDEQNNSFREQLFLLLTKIKKLHMSAEKGRKDPISTQKILISDIEMQRSIKIQTRSISPECGREIGTLKARTDDLITSTAFEIKLTGSEPLVKFQNYLIIYIKFTGKLIAARVGIG